MCRYGPAPVQTKLSCMARDNFIYVVANIGDKKLCNISDVGCPDDGQYYYNSAVVYDSQGKLVARYHKVRSFRIPIYSLSYPLSYHFSSVDYFQH